MKNRNRKKLFTLVELLVSLGVFSLLLVIFMQFFSSTRTVWVNSEKRTQVYANARVAMDMVSQLINSFYYSSANVTPGEEGRFLFRAHQPSNALLSHKLYFASKTSIDLPGRNPIRFIGLQVPTPEDAASYPASTCGDPNAPLYNKLMMTVVSDEDPYFGAFFPPFLRAPGGSIGSPGSCANVLGDLVGILNGTSKLRAAASTFVSSRIELLDKVTRFNVKVFDANGGEITLDASRNIDNVVPSMIAVTLAVLNDEDFARWVEMKGGRNNAETASAAAFRQKNEFVFTRCFYVGNR